MAFEIRKGLNGYILLDDGFTEGTYTTIEGARVQQTKLEREDTIFDFIEEKLEEIRTELRDRYGMTRDEATKYIRHAA